MSNPTISILSSRRLRLTKTGCSRGMSSGRVADSMSSRPSGRGQATRPRRRCDMHTNFITPDPNRSSPPVASRLKSARDRRARPDQPDHRRLRRQPPPDRARRTARPSAAAPTCWSFPSWRCPAIRPRICSSGRPSSTRRARRWRRWRAPTARGGDAARRASLVGFPEALAGRPRPGARVANTRRADRGRRDRRRGAQVAAADLRRLRRVALLRAGDRGGAGRRSAGARLGISICEDIWNDADFWPHRLYRARSDRGAGRARAPRSSSTSRRRRTRWRSATCARACWPRRRGAGAGRWCS